MIEISIVLPAFNEGMMIQHSLQMIENKFKAMKLDYEIIVVDDGSVDDTLLKANKYEGKSVTVYHYKKNRGKGFAVRYGMTRAVGRYKMFMDVDLSTSLDAVELFLKTMRAGGHDVIIGDRRSKSSRFLQPWHRRVLGQGFVVLSQCCVGGHINDFTCGFKMFNRGSVEALFKRQRIFGWAFDTELMGIAMLHGLRIAQLPVAWKDHQPSHVRSLRAVFSVLVDLIKIKWNLCRGRYG
jgi:dolichyl-phosphate beta-glucosyltransferase